MFMHEPITKYCESMENGQIDKARKFNIIIKSFEYFCTIFAKIANWNAKTAKKKAPRAKPKNQSPFKKKKSPILATLTWFDTYNT